jgi:uncharacterized membrane protein
MELIQIALMVSTLLCSLVAGFVFAFAVVVIPGIQTLNDRGFLQAFQVMDRVIQRNHPLFMLVWLGSALVLLASTILGWWALDGPDRALLGTACAVYLFGVQLPTVTINIPLNNQLQAADLESLTEPALREVRARFESRWIRWNSIRTVLATLTTVLLIVLLIRCT